MEHVLSTHFLRHHLIDLSWVYQRQRHHEGTADAKLALGPDLTTMEHHDAFTDSKANASALDITRQAGINSVEAAKDPLKVIGAYTDSVVPHMYSKHGVGTLKCHINCATRWRILDGIFQDNVERLA
jgi:hypothetical protein